MMFLIRRPDHYGQWKEFQEQAEGDMNDRPLTWDELAWYRSRIRDMVALARTNHPQTKLMWRVLHQSKTNTGGRNVQVFQLNQSARQVMQEEGIPIFEWAKLIQGNGDYSGSLLPSSRTLC
jgi:hypothetical protein